MLWKQLVKRKSGENIFSFISLFYLQVFHCVHFECPSCDEEDLSKWATSPGKSLPESPKDSQQTDQVQLTETATEAEELPIETPETTD